MNTKAISTANNRFARLSLLLALPAFLPAACNQSKTSSQSNSQASCNLPRHYSVPLTKPVALKCYQNLPRESGHMMDILNVTIPESGPSLARFQYTASNLNNQSSPESSHGFSYGYTLKIRTNGTDSKLFAEDICPLEKTQGLKQLIGAGASDKPSTPSTNTTTGATHIQVQGESYLEPCFDNQIQINEGSVLDVWVADPKPECSGDLFIVDSHVVREWSGTKPEVLQSFQLTPNQYQIMSALQVNETPTPNTCSAKPTAHFSLAHVFAGQTIGASDHYFTGSLPGNQTHTVAGLNSIVAGPGTFSLIGQSSTDKSKITVGDYGDVVVGAVRTSP